MKGGNKPKFPGLYSNHSVKALKNVTPAVLPLQSRFHEEIIHRNLLNTSLGRDSTHQHINTHFLYAELNRKHQCKIISISALWACSGLGSNWRPADCSSDLKTQKIRCELLHWD